MVLTYTDEQEATFSICMQIVNAISFIACTIVIFVYLKHECIRSLATRILVWISITGVLHCFAVVLAIGGSLDVGPVCTMQGFLLQFTAIAEVLWSLVVTAVIYQILLHPNNSHTYSNNIDAIWYRMHAVLWSMCTITALIPLCVKGAYAPTGGTCWITLTSPTLRYLMYYIPWFICIVIMIVLSFKVTVYVCCSEFMMSQQHSEDNALRIVRTIWYYPLIVLGFNLCFAIRRADEAVTGEAAAFPLAVLSIVFGYARQIPNTLIFCWTPNVRQVLGNAFGVIGHATDGASVQDAQRVPEESDDGDESKESETEEMTRDAETVSVHTHLQTAE